MTIRTKHKIITGFLVAFAAWPLVHFVLAQVLDVSPWKCAGWAMYTTPPNSISTLVYRVENGQRADQLPLVPPHARARFELQREYDRFGDRRVYFNTLIKPDRFAEAILRYFPREDEIEIVINRFYINRSTGYVEKITEDTTYRYRRDDFE